MMASITVPPGGGALDNRRVDRRLAAILAADVAGYSRLMGADEVGTLTALQAHRRELIDPMISAHHGRIVKTTGDGMLVEFGSVVDAVRCAVAFAVGYLGRRARRHRWRNWVRLHITGMGTSYILLLTAFYVDNGKSLPLWKELPPIAFWLLPAAVGIPLIVRALLWHRSRDNITCLNQTGSSLWRRHEVTRDPAHMLGGTRIVRPRCAPSRRS